MTNKILIQEKSVELYEHYIDDERWERTLSFPRGGLTYLVSNGTIKFYAYEDYLYRNCLMSMQLPIYVKDDFKEIDGEYDDIDEIVVVLDRIFPTNDMDEELKNYLLIKDAEKTYQPIGQYVTDEELVEALEDYYTKPEIDDIVDGIEDEIAELDEKKLDISAFTEYMEDYYTKDETSGATEIQEALDLKADKDDVYAKQESDERFQPIGDYVSADTYNTYTAQTDATLSSLEERKMDKTAFTEAMEDYYTKEAADVKFQDKGNYVSATTYNGYTAQTNATLDDLEERKLDASAYTPTDMSNYYTKIETDTKLDKKLDASAYTPTDLSSYYTKIESDAKFQEKGDYVTTSKLITYINNLQQQINSLAEAVSGCCETPETIYRWITLTDEYVCDGLDKYERQQKQVSTDGGITWSNVSPAEYRKGSLIEVDSEDCGHIAPQYRWKQSTASDYICSGTSKYYKEYYQVSTDGGVTWSNVTPTQTRTGSLIEAQSTDCGYVGPQYRWYTSQREYICSGTTKYEKQYYQVSTDGGVTWNNVSPLQTRMGSVIETQSTDCGYIEPQYRWQQASASDYVCSGTSKYYKEYYQVSTDGGNTWRNVTPTQTRTGGLIEAQSTDCGYVGPQYRWKDTSSTTCSGYNKCHVAVYQVSTDGGNTWSNVTPTQTRTGSVIEEYSYSCGYSGTPKLKIYNDNGDVAQLNCESSPSPILTSEEYWRTYSSIENCSGRHFDIGDCVTQIGDKLTGNTISFGPCAVSINYGNNVTKAKDGNGGGYDNPNLTGVTLSPKLTELNFKFSNCTSLRTMTIPASITRIYSGTWKDCTSLESLTFLSTTPPDLGDYYATTFQNTNNCILYVPQGSVTAYKNADGWKEYKDRIMPING